MLTRAKIFNSELVIVLAHGNGFHARTFAAGKVATIFTAWFDLVASCG